MDERLIRDAALAMTIVTHEANDSAPRFPGDQPSQWSVDDGARRFLEVLASKGWSVIRTDPNEPEEPTPA